jgi:DNA-binding IclR family transcriptional regulator
MDEACHPVTMTTARDRPPEEAPEDTSFARGLRVFLAIADRGTMRADELAGLLETPLSTVYRYLRTLTEFGFVDRHEGAYRLGPRLLVGGGSTISSEELIRRADPILIMLAAETGETAVISRRIGLAAVCLHQQPSDHALRVMLEVGRSTPLGVGALGRVLLAYAPTEIQDEVLGDGTGDVQAVPVGIGPAALRSVTSQGMALTDGELPAGCVAIAAPVLRDDGIVAAVGVLAPSARATTAWRARASALVASAGASLGRSLRAST